MSGEIAFHIQEEIIKRLPVKSLVRFRSVCKTWKRLIDSSYFIAAHTVRQDQCQRLFVKYFVARKAQYASVIDDDNDDNFPTQRFVPTLPLSIKLLKMSRVVGSCNGLVCLDGYHSGKPMVVLWNPSIRKSIAIDAPVLGMSHVRDQTAFGFGVCPVTNDPKIVMIPQLSPFLENRSKFNDPREVMVHTLSSGKWKSLSSNVLSKSVRVRWYCQVIDRFIYWCGWNLMAEDGCTRWICNLILSFDMTDDAFQVIDLPDCLASSPFDTVSISKIRESLVILESSTNCDVWMMENGVFTKLFTVVVQYASIRALGFRKSGKSVMKIKFIHVEDEIVEYDPNSKFFCSLEIGGIKSISSVNSYMETLLLLGRSDCTSC